MSLTFGTSGLRGLVADMPDDVCARYAAAFIDHLGDTGPVLIARDLRASSPRIARAVAAGLAAAGAEPLDCGALPTPALALESAARDCPAIMVTGSHIPADRNGIKFYTCSGEIGKEDEPGILAAFAARSDTAASPVVTGQVAGVLDRYAARYADSFAGSPLSGWRVGVYQHSSVARDVLVEILDRLGATTVPLGWSDVFVPVDTEAVDPGAAKQLSDWATGENLDAIVSTDGDADRPMVTDRQGRILAGDILGPLTARFLGAEVVVTPVSSNTLVDAMGAFRQVLRTRIGSPYVLAGMSAHDGAKVVGYEANGGFLLGFTTADGLAPLMTRDSVLPIVAPMIDAASRGISLADLVEDLPGRRTHADRLQGIPTAESHALIAALSEDKSARAKFFAAGSTERDVDLTDGLRVRFENGQIVHLRPSGNAPELRCYAEAEDGARAVELVATHLERLRARLT